MFPLNCTELPKTTAALTTEMTAGMKRFAELKKSKIITAAGDVFNLEHLTVDLSGAVVHNELQEGKQQIRQTETPDLQCAELKVIGHPIHCRGAEIHVDLSAQNVSLKVCRDQSGKLVLIPGRGTGRITTRVSHASLESLLLSIAQGVSQQQGITIQQTELTLTQTSARTLKVVVNVNASKKVFIASVSGTVVIEGELTLDEKLTATLNNLRCRGSGITSFVAPLIQNKLNAYEGYQLALAALPLGDFQLQDVQLKNKSGELAIEARLRTAPRSRKAG